MPAFTSLHKECSPSRSVRTSSPTISPTARRPGTSPIGHSQRSFGALLLSNQSTGQVIGPLSTGVTINQLVTDISPAPLAANRPAARLRDRRRRLLRDPDAGGRPLLARRAVHLKRSGPAGRRSGQPGPRPGAAGRSRSARRAPSLPRQLASTTSPASRSRATTTSPGPPPARRPARSVRASSRSRASTRSPRWST